MQTKNKVPKKTRCAKGRKFAHHWKIMQPNGKLSTGVCIYCKKKREFENSQTYSSWYDKARGMVKPDRTRPMIKPFKFFQEEKK